MNRPMPYSPVPIEKDMNCPMTDKNNRGSIPDYSWIYYNKINFMKDKLFGIKTFFASLLLIGFLFGCADKKTTEKEAIVSFQQRPGKLTILVDDQVFASYIYEDGLTTRPYFENVISPCGTQVTRNRPIKEGDPKDHGSWHPGIWMSFADINGV